MRAPFDDGELEAIVCSAREGDRHVLRDVPTLVAEVREGWVARVAERTALAGQSDRLARVFAGRAADEDGPARAVALDACAYRVQQLAAELRARGAR